MQQESAQAYQLGSLEDEYTTDAKKVLANFGLMLVFALIAPLIVSGTSHTVAYYIYFIIASFIFFFVVGGGFLLMLYVSYRHLHVYIYANGLLYLNGNTRRVIYWQQMNRVYANRGYLNISVKNEIGISISIPVFVSRFGKLRARIKQEIANHRNPG